jgi:hypothetical protein
VIAEHERIAADARDAVHAGAAWRAPAGPEQQHDRPHRQPGRRYRGARIVEQPLRDARPPPALDLDVDRGLEFAVADAKQAIRRALPRPVHAGIELAERLEPTARERQAQDRSRQAAQQVSKGDVGLAHCCPTHTARL